MKKKSIAIKELTPTAVDAHIPPEVEVKPKLALCMSKADLPALYQRAYRSHVMPLVMPLNEGLFQLPTTLRDRAECEGDETQVQLLPYIVVSNERGEIFSYYRGGGGNEARLHGAISIGVGGHVDIAPPGTPGSMSLEEVLELEADRELSEELGVINTSALHFSGVIIDRTNAVGRVHLGLLTHYQIKATDTIIEEATMIEQGQFRSLMDLRRPEVYDRLENWSRAVVDHLLMKSDQLRANA